MWGTRTILPVPKATGSIWMLDNVNQHGPDRIVCIPCLISESVWSCVTQPGRPRSAEHAIPRVRGSALAPRV